jgi:hypothetical protein
VERFTEVRLRASYIRNSRICELNINFRDEERFAALLKRPCVSHLIVIKRWPCALDTIYSTTVQRYEKLMYHTYLIIVTRNVNTNFWAILKYQQLSH